MHCSYFWGWLSDKKGRRPVLLITIAGNGIFSFLFGFSTNIPLAMVLRFLSGLINGEYVYWVFFFFFFLIDLKDQSLDVIFVQFSYWKKNIGAYICKFVNRLIGWKQDVSHGKLCK